MEKPCLSCSRQTTPSLRGLLLVTLLVWLAAYLASCSSARPAMQGQARMASTTTHTMTLSDHEFAPVDFVPAPGDNIIIRNRSPISHSIYVTYPDGTVVNLGVQTPGTMTSWMIPKEAQGEFVLQCWIHPIIHASLLVNAGKAASPVSSSSSVSTGSASSRLSSQEIFNGRQNICSSRNRRT